MKLKIVIAALAFGFVTASITYASYEAKDGSASIPTSVTVIAK